MFAMLDVMYQRTKDENERLKNKKIKKKNNDNKLIKHISILNSNKEKEINVIKSYYKKELNKEITIENCKGYYSNYLEYSSQNATGKYNYLLCSIYEKN